MKKNILFVTFFLVSFHIKAQHINDANFAQAIRQDCYNCIDAADNLTKEAQTRTSLTVGIHNISDIAGIEGFPALTFLSCSNNNLTALPDNLPLKLTYINVNFNKITQLKKIPNGVREFNCANNKLTALPEIPNSLLKLDCSYNRIAALPPLKSLVTLYCTDNLLTNLPPLPTALEGLICSYNQLKTLPPLPKTLFRVSCQYNLDIKCLPLLPEGLVYLDITKNIVCLPNVVKNLAIDTYEGTTATAVNLPICNILRPLPCDTFPQTKPQDSISLVDKTIKIAIFPNPTEGEVQINCQNCTIKKVLVFNAIGQVMRQKQTALLDFYDLASGLYFVQIETDKGYNVIERIVKM